MADKYLIGLLIFLIVYLVIVATIVFVRAIIYHHKQHVCPHSGLCARSKNYCIVCKDICIKNNEPTDWNW